MKRKPSEDPSAFLLGMIGTLYQKPASYAQSIGELNSLLWFSHYLWSGIAGRDLEFIHIRCRLYTSDVARRFDKLRLKPISNPAAVSAVVTLWKQIDAELGVDTHSDQFDDSLN